MDRRDVLKTFAAGAVALALPRGGGAESAVPDSGVETYTYKTAGGCAIKADVYRSKDSKAPRPVVLMIHGGALIMGSRGSVQKDLIGPLTAKGCVVVSIDYRLAPETKLLEIIKDLQDAYRWIVKEGPGLFGADPARIAVQGGSAGGYLTLMCGICVSPPPLALVSYYGYGDIIGDWYSKPDPYYLTQPPVSREEAYKTVGDGVPCGDPQGPKRHDYYVYCRQHGLWPYELTGMDPGADGPRFRPFCPLKNIGHSFPPTLLAHGDQDTDVPYAQSVALDAALTEANVEHEFITLKGAGHGFAHADPKDYKTVIDHTIAFLTDHLSL